MKSLDQDPGKTVYICDFVFIRRLRLEPVDSALFEFFLGQQKVNVFQFLWKHYHIQCRGSISPVIPSSRKHFNSRLPSLMLLININTKFNVAVDECSKCFIPSNCDTELRETADERLTRWQTLDNLWTLPMVYWFGFRLLKLASNTLLLPTLANHRIIKSTKSFSRHLTLTIF